MLAVFAVRWTSSFASAVLQYVTSALAKQTGSDCDAVVTACLNEQPVNGHTTVQAPYLEHFV